MGRSRTEKSGGLYGSEYAGVSNDYMCESYTPFD